MTADEARRLIDSWVIAMQARRLSKSTIYNYTTGARQLIGFAENAGQDPDFTSPEQVRAWLAGMDATGRTMRLKLAAARAFARWLADEGEIPAAGFGRVAWPKIDRGVPDALSREQADRLISSCDPATFTGVRDAAIISLMFDALLRSDELLSVRRRGDIDLKARTVHVRRGKGGKERWSAFSSATARRLDRYERRREKYAAAAGTEAYWVGLGGRPLRYQALYATIARRGERIGLDVHPHMTRAGGAIEWRRKGGSTEGLMTIGGWDDLEMVRLYTRKAEIDLALNEARRLHDQD